MTETEAQFIGAMIANTDIYFRHQPREWWFVGDALATYKTIRAMIEANEEVNLVSVGDKIGHAKAGKLPTHSAANASYYAKKLAEIGKLRELKRLGEFIQGSENPSEIVEEAHRRLDHVLSGCEDYQIETSREIAFKAVEQIEERYKLRGKLPGLKIGFPLLENMMLGLQPQRMYVIGARPSQGKSALMMNMVAHLAKSEMCGVINLESSNDEFMMRLMSHTSKIRASSLYTGLFSSSDFPRLLKAAEGIYERNLMMYDKPNCTLGEVQAQARRMAGKGAKAIFIDYLQLIKTPGETDRTKQAARASIGVKELARELNLPIIALAQLRRDSDGRRPGMGDFQHSSQIEQDADSAMLLYHRVLDSQGRELKKSRAEDESECQESWILLEKNRDGMTGRVHVSFAHDFLTFTENN
jgi:replicative DNA helicase